MEKKLGIFSLGGAGNAILHSLLDNNKLISDPGKQCVYINFAESDLAKKYSGIHFLLDYGGTGRDPKVGEKIVRENSDEIDKFLHETITDKKTGNIIFDEILLISSLGGGTGSSLVPHLLGYLTNKSVNVSLVSVMPSDSEGVATLPNAIKAFQSIYNDYILTNKLKSCFIFDNQKFSNVLGANVYDYVSLNKGIADFIDKIFNYDVLYQSTEGFNSLDIKEYSRVLFWGKGIGDVFYFTPDKNKFEDTDYESSVYDGRFKVSTAKAVALQLNFKNKAESVPKETIDFANKVVEKFRKKFVNSFFVFGFNFNNKSCINDFEVKLVVNGLQAPMNFISTAKRAAKGVEKIKRVNDAVTTGGVDLDF